MKNILLLGFFVFLSMQLHADVATEGEVDVNFKVTNLKDYPGYTFHYYYQHYFYDQGYQLGELEKIEIEQGKEYASGGRGSQTYISVTDENGNVVGQTSEDIGGVAQNQAAKVSHLIQVIKITGIADGKVSYEVVKRMKVFYNGKEKEDNLIPGWLDNNRWVLYGLIPAVSLFCLVLLFMVRRKRSFNPVPSAQ